VHKGKVTTLTNKSFILTGTSDPELQPRAAIWSSSNVDLWLNMQFSNRDIVTAIWNIEHEKQVYIASVYCDINYEPISTELRKLVEHCHSRSIPLLIAADTNAHSTLWGSNKDNDRGRTFEEFIIENSLLCLNQGAVPTFDCSRGQTIIDVSLASSDMSGMVNSWRVLPNNMCSDHKCIEVKLQTNLETDFFRSFKEVDWKAFQERCTNSIECQSWPRLWTTTTIDTALEKLNRAVQGSLDNVAPLRKRPAKLKISWFNGELKELRIKVNKTHRKAQKGKASWDTFQQIRAKYKTEIQKAKEQSWREFTEASNDFKAAAKLEKIIQGQPSQRVNLLKKPNGSMSDSPQEAIAILMHEHFPLCTDPTPQTEIEDWLESLEEPTTLQPTNWITTELIKNIMNEFGADKAAGPDLFKPKILQNLPIAIIERLCDIYNACIQLGYTPALWRTSRTIFIPKPGKKDYSEPRAFRPISLTSFLFKTLEKLVYKHIKDNLSLHNNQHAFRQGRNTESALSFTIDYIEKSILRKQYALAVFLDIEGAFDNISLEAMENGMRDHDIPHEIIQWYKQYMHNRMATLELRGAKTVKKLSRGTPQGGVLSPLIWNLAFDDLLSRFDQGPVRICGFADDAALIIIGPDPHSLAQIMNKELKKAEDWAKSRSLRFSIAKTQALLFNTKNKPPKIKPIKLYGKDIPFVTSTKYLGVILDRKLNWNLHIKSKIDAAKKRLMMLKNKLGKIWGPSPYITKWLWTGVLRPAISYACHTWIRDTTKKRITEQFDRLQSLAMRLIGNFRSGTPTAGLQVALGLPPLDLELKRIAVKTYKRLYINESLPRTWDGIGNTQNGHIYLLQKLYEQWELPELGGDDVCPLTELKCKAYVDTNSFQTGNDYTGPGWRAYTDGSKMEDHIGSGFCIYENNTEKANLSLYLGQKASVYQAELVAISRAAQDLGSMVSLGDEVTILSDSRSAVQAVCKETHTSKTELKCIKSINNLSMLAHVTIRWVKAHVGIPGNEKADDYAKKGVLERDSTELEIVPPSISNFKNELEEKLIAEWNQRWFQQTKCRQTKLFYPEIDLKKSQELIQLPRDQLSRIIRITTGHNFMNRHKAIIDNSLTNKCRLCQQNKEDSEHIVAECEPLWRIRLEAFNHPFLDSPIPWEAAQLNKFLKNRNVMNLEDEDFRPVLGQDAEDEDYNLIVL
jgi:ribonuclease HI